MTKTNELVTITPEVNYEYDSHENYQFQNTKNGSNKNRLIVGALCGVVVVLGVALSLILVLGGDTAEDETDTPVAPTDFPTAQPTAPKYVSLVISAAKKENDTYGIVNLREVIAFDQRLNKIELSNPKLSEQHGNHAAENCNDNISDDIENFCHTKADHTKDIIPYYKVDMLESSYKDLKSVVVFNRNDHPSNQERIEGATISIDNNLFATFPKVSRAEYTFVKKPVKLRIEHNTIINLREVQVFDANDEQIQLYNGEMSSLSEVRFVDHCIDGNVENLPEGENNDANICHTKGDDTNPFIQFDMAIEDATAWNKIVVYNRNDHPSNQNRIQGAKISVGEWKSTFTTDGVGLETYTFENN